MILASLLLAPAALLADAPYWHLSPVQIMASGKPIDVERTGHSAPFVGDIDGDGKRDLIVGEYFEGRVRRFRNQGSNTEPRFEAFEWIKAGDSLARVPEG